MEDLLDGIPTHFRVQDKLGSGVTSSVFRARDSAVGRTVALKVMYPPASPELEAKQQFRIEQEFRAAGRLHGASGVLNVFNVGTTPRATSWIAMELAEHGTLADRLEGNSVLSVSDCARLMVQVLRILLEVHGRDVVHGDISPSNIFFRDVTIDSVVLGDFGLCRIDEETQSGGFTPAYAAPELFHGEPATPSTDCFAVAVVISECLTRASGLHEPRSNSVYLQAQLKSVIDALTMDDPDQRITLMSALKALEQLDFSF